MCIHSNCLLRVYVDQPTSEEGSTKSTNQDARRYLDLQSQMEGGDKIKEEEKRSDMEEGEDEIGRN